jgi:hypothetical protein
LDASSKRAAIVEESAVRIVGLVAVIAMLVAGTALYASNEPSGASIANARALVERGP